MGIQQCTSFFTNKIIRNELCSVFSNATKKELDSIGKMLFIVETRKSFHKVSKGGEEGFRHIYSSGAMSVVCQELIKEEEIVFVSRQIFRDKRFDFLHIAKKSR